MSNGNNQINFWLSKISCIFWTKPNILKAIWTFRVHDKNYQRKDAISNYWICHAIFIAPQWQQQQQRNFQWKICKFYLKIWMIILWTLNILPDLEWSKWSAHWPKFNSIQNFWITQLIRKKEPNISQWNTEVRLCEMRAIVVLWATPFD